MLLIIPVYFSKYQLLDLYNFFLVFYLEYFQYSDPFHNVLVKTLQEDTAFKLKIFRQITNQFPWMKELAVDVLYLLLVHFLEC